MQASTQKQGISFTIFIVFEIRYGFYLWWKRHTLFLIYKIILYFFFHAHLVWTFRELPSFVALRGLSWIGWRSRPRSNRRVERIRGVLIQARKVFQCPWSRCAVHFVLNLCCTVGQQHFILEMYKEQIVWINIIYIIIMATLQKKILSKFCRLKYLH